MTKLAKVSSTGAMTEKDVITSTGLSEDAIRRTRLAKLKNGADWYRDEAHMRIHYTENGLRKLQEALGGIEIAPPAAGPTPAPAQPPPSSKKIAPPMDQDARRTMVVERICPNPTWVECRVDGVLVKVRVRNNRQMARGKVLEKCAVTQGAWVYSGRCW